MAGMTQSMQYTMPLMFGFFSLQFPAGLSLYFILSNLIGIGQGLLIRRNMPGPDEGKAPSSKKQQAKAREDGRSTGAGADGNGSKPKKNKGGKSRAKRKRR